MKKTAEIIVCAFIAVELALYVAFVAIDVALPKQWMLSSILKLLSIVICFAFSLTALGYTCEMGFARKFALASGLTVLCDAILLFSTRFEVGIAVFCVVQLARICAFSGYRWRTTLFSALIAALVGMVVWVFTHSFVFGIASAYAILIFAALSASIRTKILPMRNAWLSRIGMALFVCCDICVAIFNLSSDGAIYDVAALLMWVFYLPSQTLLALAACALPERDR